MAFAALMDIQLWQNRRRLKKRNSFSVRSGMEKEIEDQHYKRQLEVQPGVLRAVL